ncbi:MAG: c-type cytochrome [Burkholderiaceae bacterium]|jgi:cytochrome c553
MRKVASLLAVPLLALSAQSAFANNPLAGRYLAANCANCHGTNGQSVGGMEALAGYDRNKFVQTMKAFQSGEKPATLMHQIAKGYTDAQINLMADFFASQKKAR